MPWTAAYPEVQHARKWSTIARRKQTARHTDCLGPVSRLGKQKNRMKIRCRTAILHSICCLEKYLFSRGSIYSDLPADDSFQNDRPVLSELLLGIGRGEDT